MQAYIFDSKIAGLFYHNFVYMSREIGNFMQFTDNFERIYTMLAKIRQRRSQIGITYCYILFFLSVRIFNDFHYTRKAPSMNEGDIKIFVEFSFNG